MYMLRGAKAEDIKGIEAINRASAIRLDDKGLKEQKKLIPGTDTIMGYIASGQVYVGAVSGNIVSYAVIDIDDEGIGRLAYLASTHKGAGAELLSFLEDSLWDDDVPSLIVLPHPTLAPYFGSLGYKAAAGCYVKNLTYLGEVTGAS